MIVLFAFVLPPLFFVLAARRRFASPRALTLGALAVALISSIAVYRLVTASSLWKEGTEIAWTGVATARDGASLAIGGPRETSVVGWPNGASWPRVEVTPSGADGARLEVRGGGAAVETPAGVVNGVLIAEGETKDVGGFRVGYRTRFLRLVRRLVVFKGEEEIVSLRLRATSSRVTTIGPLLASKVSALRVRRDPAASALALALETWGAELRVLMPDRRSVRVLDHADRDPARPGATADVRLPVVLTLRFPDLVLPVEIGRAAGGRGVLATFLPPWRLACPLPPPVEGAKNGETVLTVTGEAAPGDRAFELPLGRATPDPRARLTVSRGPGGDFVFENAPPPRPADSIADALPPGMRLTEEPERFRAEGMTSAVGVPAGRLLLHVATVHDLPSSERLIEILGLALLALAVGLFVTRADAGRDGGALLSVVVVLWSFAALRLLLAFRYAIDPTGLDRTSVKGLAAAAAILIALPAFFLLVTSLYRDGFVVWEGRAGIRRGYLQAAYVVFITAAAWTAGSRAPGIWQNLPQRLRPGTSWVVHGIALAFVLLLFVQLLHTYVLTDEQRERFGWLSPLSFVRRVALRWGPSLWGVYEEAPVRFMAVAAVLFLALLGAMLVFGVVNRLIAERFFQEVASPFLIVGLPAIFWISAKARWGPESDGATLPGHLQVALFALLFVFVPIVSPLALGDTGGLFATLAFVLPMSGVLLAARPRRFGAWSLAAALLAIALAATVLVGSAQILPGFAVSKLERGIARYLVFQRGPDAQKLLPFARISSELGEGVTERSLQNTIEHTWENVSIAHWGKWSGLGFAKAPTRRSMVPLVPIQSDSTFSFFVVSEHGLVGGGALLLLYALPLVVVLRSARRRFDVGHVLAAAIAASFLNEAVVHAAMNLNALPFTGRNLPLLSVNSITEAIRWIVLFGLMGQCLLWRRTGDEEGEVFSPAGGSVLSGGSESPEPARGYAGAAVAASAVSLVLLVWFWFLPALRVAQNPQLEATFSWDGLLAFVQSMADRGHLSWDADKNRIVLGKMPVELHGESFLEQEIERFNSLPDDEKLPRPEALGKGFASARTLEAYDAAMDDLRTGAGSGRVRRRPSLFRVAVVEDGDDSDEADAREVVGANPAFNVHLGFGPDAEPSDMPRTWTRPSSKKRPALLVGPAWVNGRWRAAVDRGSAVPWAGYLADAVRSEWRRLGPVAARKRYGSLTLDDALQRAAMSFTAEKGRLLHQSLLANGRLSGLRRVLPPRVAITVVDLPSGEVLAMGGWPHMTSSASWRRAGSEWVPPAAWLERDAPDALASLYGLDRNFDRIEMGSASKPIWAAAVLDVHPGLDRLLSTRGPLVPPPTTGRDTHVENEVFGMLIPGRPWHASSSGREWCDFTRYLTRSDNTYQVRLGFLGLAESENGRVAADSSAGASPSDQESLDPKSLAPWKRYPRFPEEMKLSPSHPAAMANVGKTPLAKSLHDLFSIGVTGDDVRSRRRSFWTLDEADDASATPREGRAGLDTFAGISPQSVQLGLERLTHSREFVSRLVGGSENRWANVDFAAEFAVAVTGHAMVPHIVPGDAKPGSWRKAFPQTAAKLRPGLAGVVAKGGTAYRNLEAARAIALFARAPGVKVYAKTGTISLDRGVTSTSRLALACVKWKNEAKGEVLSGFVVSMVVEKADQGMAAEWLGEFLVANLGERAPF